jgi:L-iditol 2-dehydrogenase
MNQVAELVGTRTFHVVERDLPEPGPGEVQVRVAAVGICGSDMHSFSEGSVGDQICKYPMVLGHEPSGVILKIGTGVTGWSAGDEVALEPAIYCYHCEFCMAGQHNVCAHIRFMSSVDDAGFFRERVNLPATNLLALRCGITLPQATLLEPLAIAVHSLKFAPVKLGDEIAVIGAGPIGLLTIACLKLAGASRIWSIEPVAHRREMALAMGADAVIDPASVDPVAEILKDTGRRGVDTVYDCAAKGDTLNQAARMVRNRGAIVLTGIHADVTVSLNLHVMRRKEAALFNVRRSNHESELALDLLVTHNKLFGPLITHGRRMEKINEAFELVENYSDGVGKLLVLPGEISR